MSNESIYSQKALVACLDILGFKERVKNHLTTKDACDEFRNNLEECMENALIGEVKRGLYQKLDCFYKIILSDTIILAFDIEKVSKILKIEEEYSDMTINSTLMVLLNIINCFVKLCGNRKIFLRGGVSIGDFYWNRANNILISNALVNAHVFESNCANYARVLVDKAMIGNVEKKFQDLLITDIEDNDNANFYVLNIFFIIPKIKRMFKVQQIIDKTMNYKRKDRFMQNVDEYIYKYRNDKKIKSKYLYLKKLYDFNQGFNSSYQFSYPFLTP